MLHIGRLRIEAAMYLFVIIACFMLRLIF